MLPDYVEYCLDILQKADIKAYPVGGCVRDLLRNIQPDDYDITTNAPPEKIEQLFDCVIETGLKHGTVTVVIDHHPIEITRLRTEGGYSDCRRPDFVVPTDDIEIDLKRRDFTINAMALSSDGEIIDPFGGRDDLDKKIIRAVGSPERRFSEDALRIMRAFRFSAKLGFEIEKDTLESALKLSSRLEMVSAERVFTELYKSAVSEFPQKILPLIQNGGLAPFGIISADRLERLSLIPNERDERVALLLCCCECDDDVCDKLKMPNTIKKLYHIAKSLLETELSDVEIKRLIAKTDFKTAAKIIRIISAFNGIENDGECAIELAKQPCEIKDLAVGGNDVLSLGVKGNKIGQILEILADEVRFDQTRNTHEYLIESIKKLIKDGI